MPLVAVLVLAVQASGTSADAAAPLRPGGVPVCSGIRVSAPSLARQPRDLVFRVREILDLRFEARLRPAPRGDHLLRFEVFTPGGFLYEVLRVPFAGAAGGNPSSRPPGPGQMQSVPVPKLVLEDSAEAVRSDAVRATLPVAGTSITQTSLYGRWTVKPYLDDETAACGPAIRFTIRE
jgi:hypothetical protein